MKPKDQNVRNGHYLTKYFTQFPNLLDDINLDVYEFRLLLHYYRVGECWEGVRATSEKCNMSTGKVSEARKTLEAKGLIDVKATQYGVSIEVVDKSHENLSRYRSPDEQGVQEVGVDRSPGEKQRSPDGHKNNQLRITNEEDTAPQAADPFIFSKEVIDRLVKVRGKYGLRGSIHWTKGRHAAIMARCKESGADINGLSRMFDHRCKSWKGTEFEKYLTPDTLFRASKFQGYMEQSAAQPAKDWTEQKSDDSNEEEDGSGVPAGHTW